MDVLPIVAEKAGRQSAWMTGLAGEDYNRSLDRKMLTLPRRNLLIEIQNQTSLFWSFFQKHMMLKMSTEFTR